MNFHYNAGPKFSSDIANSKNLTFRFQRTLSWFALFAHGGHNYFYV